MAGASLTIVGGHLGAGTVTGGAAGGTGAGTGSAYGGGLFLQGNETIMLAPAAGKVERISGVIADQAGSDGAGAGGLILNGPGTLDLAAANTYTGGTTIEQGVLELANPNAAGRGGIAFASVSGEVEYSAGANLANTVSGFGGADAIDFSTIAYATGDTAVDTSGNVAIETSAGSTVATFSVSGTYTSSNFHVGKDASGNILVSYAATATVPGNGAVIACPADILGGYATEFAEPLLTRASDLSAFDAWNALAYGAGVDPGGFGFHGVPNPGGAGTGLLLDGSFGSGARDTSSIGIGSSASTGHGPGPSG
jgi:autotransporter-associated beta strand protein